MAIAFRSSTALARAAAQVRQADAAAGQAKSQLQPQVSLWVAEAGQTVNLRTFGISFPGLPARVGPFQTMDARANASYNVFNASARTREKAAREQAISSQALAAAAHETLAFQVATAFHHALRAQSAVAAVERQADLARQLHRVTEDRVALGASSRLDSTRSRQQVLALEQGALEARHALTRAKLQLANLIHATPTADYRLVGGPAVVVAPAAERPEMRALSQSLRAAELRVKAAREQRLPVASLVGNYGQTGRAWNDNLSTFRVAGQVTLPLFTGGRIEAETAEAMAKVDEIKAQIEELRSALETESLEARSALETAQAQLETLRESAKLAREELDLATERFRGGVADNTEVINAQDRLARAEDGAVRGEFAVDLARAHVARAQGVAERTYRGGAR
jgi:outer membrane protein TolC